MKLLFLIVSFIILQFAEKTQVLYSDKPGTYLTFILLTDLHVTPGAASDSALHRIVDEINCTTADFVVVTGDLTNSGSDEELSAVKRELDRIIIPCYVIPGNHETNWSESAGMRINEMWGDDKFIARHKGFLLAGVSTGPFMKMGDGVVKKEDIYWLKKGLSEKKENEALIAFTHYPLNEGLSNWFDITSVLKSAGCRIVFCGHGHSLKLFNFDGIPGIMCRSVILGKSPLPGYNIIHLRNDSVIVNNKQLGSEQGKFFAGFNYKSPDTLKFLPVSPRPDFSLNKNYTNYRIISQFSDSSSVFTGPCIAGDSIIVYGNSSGILKAINRYSGKVLWERKVAAPVFSTPVYSAGMVLAGTVDGRIIGIESKNGDLLWSISTGSPVLSEGVTDGDYLYIGGGARDFLKIECKSGKIAWKYSFVEGQIQGGATLSRSSVFFGAWDRHFYCLDRETGKLRWKWNNGKSQVLYSPGNIYPVSSGNRVFIVAPDRFMTAIDEISGKEIWRTGRHMVRESMGASPDGSVIYAKLMNDTIIAVSAKKDIAVTEWKVDAGFGYEHNPCPMTATGKMILAGTRDGVIIAINPVTHAVMWKYKAGNSSVNKIVVNKNGMIWCTLVEGIIVGIESS